MKDKKSTTITLEDEVPTVFEDDAIPVLKDVVATQDEMENMRPQFKQAQATPALSRVIDSAIKIQFDKLASTIQDHFSKLNQPLLTPDEIGRELAEAVRKCRQPASPKRQSGRANRLQYAPPVPRRNENAMKVTTEMDKTYNPHAIEQRWYEAWEASNYFAPSSEGSPYCIMIPPPNVTGSLHMGHAFQDTIMDALIRYHRMKGHNTLWQAGTDHAGIATQMVVERQLNAHGKTRHDLGRDAFIDQIWKWKKESGGTITRQLRRMGASLDWSRERFTMDDGLSEAVHEVFVRLHEEGLIYRGKRLVNWDPVLHTAVSDLEVISQEEDGSLWHFKYPLADGSGHVIVATTRPETMLGDTAVAVHPEDERYKHLIGKEIALPLTARKIPVIADDYVDPEFGSGCVKITPAHDFNDYAIGQRHHLEMINILTEDAKLNNAVPVQYRDLDRFEARKKVVADLEALGLLLKTDPHKLMVPRGDRSHTVIEPLLTDQWFVKAEPLAKPAIEAVENGDIKFVPDNWKNTYFEWMRNIEDWCISRQIWWGHRIPAWYDEDGNIFVARSEEVARSKARAKHGHDVALTQDTDVLDTWFSSALWPFSTLGWPEHTKELEAFYPTSVLVTGFDIIFFWVARMIMMGLKFTGKVPFKEVYIHGLVRDGHGQKMSKSKGNVLDPIDLIDGIDLETLVSKRTSGLMQPEMAAKIEKATRSEFPDGIQPFGTDALRFTFAALASTGRDIKFDLHRTEGYRNFCNKLWNAARYVLMNTEEKDCGQPGFGGTNPPDASSEALQASPLSGGELELSLADRWILSRLQRTTEEVTQSIEQYRFDHAAQAIYEFTWNEYCDWYLELSKVVLNDDNSSETKQRGTRHTLVNVLESILRLSHPLMPYITEEIWQRVAPLTALKGDAQGSTSAAGGRAPGAADTIMLQPYPSADAAQINTDIEAEMEWVMNFILGVRTIRGEMNIPPGKPLPVLLANGDKTDTELLQRNHAYLNTLAKLESITWLDDASSAPESATALVGEMKVLIPMAGLINKEDELARLGKQFEKGEKDLARIEAKLNNESFIGKAPEAVVAKEHQKAAELRTLITSLIEQISRIKAL